MDNGHEPATKQDVKDAVENLEHRMDRRFDDLTELVRDTETKLLQAFYGYAKSNEVEKRLHIPPAQ